MIIMSKRIREQKKNSVESIEENNSSLKRSRKQKMKNEESIEENNGTPSVMSKRSRKQKKNGEESIEEDNGTLSVFPADIILNILSRLPFDAVFNCKLVSRNWRSLIGLPRFADMHVRFYRKLLRLDDDDDDDSEADAVQGNNTDVSLGILFSIQFINFDKYKLGAYYGDYHENKQFSYTSKSMLLLNHPQLNNNKSRCYSLVGSCNGLVCYYVPFADKLGFYICNHMTKEYVYLLEKNPNYPEDPPKCISGFGYIPSSNEYKIVRIYRDSGKIQVYTIGKGSVWRDIGEIKGDLERRYYVSNVGMLANGALHWLDYATMKIMAFDLAEEKFDEVQSPPCFLAPGYDGKKQHFQLRVLRRFLCVLHLELGKGVDIWFLQKINQCWTWSKKFSIPAKEWDWNLYDTLALTNSGKLLLLKRHCYPCGSVYHVKLCSYDPTTATIKQLVEDNQVSAMLEFEAIPHMNSFISLKALGEKCKQRKTYKRKLGAIGGYYG